jgi:Bacterial fructose-1,6-bisphosphatase, glpX-encoded
MIGRGPVVASKDLLDVTEATALACGRHLGRGDPARALQAATTAMLSALQALGTPARVMLAPNPFRRHERWASSPGTLRAVPRSAPSLVAGGGLPVTRPIPHVAATPASAPALWRRPFGPSRFRQRGTRSAVEVRDQGPMRPIAAADPSSEQIERLGHATAPAPSRPGSRIISVASQSTPASRPPRWHANSGPPDRPGRSKLIRSERWARPHPPQRSRVGGRPCAVSPARTPGVGRGAAPAPSPRARARTRPPRWRRRDRCSPSAARCWESGRCLRPRASATLPR